MRILGKGKTAQGIKEVYPDAVMYDDSDKESYDINSDELTIVSPGFPPHNYLVKNTKNISSDYDLFLDKDIYTIWISGTNGKTTTTQMTQHLLESEGFECGGNIGTPLAKISSSKKLILESSSFTLHYTNKVKPNIYLLLPISDDHLSWHGTFEEYENAKLKPLTMMDKNDIAIVPSKYKEFKTDAKLYIYNNSEELAKQFDIEIEKINFNEPFLIDSVLALSAQKIINDKSSYEKINNFKVDKHKVEEFRDKFDRLWVDDSKATNVDATIWALKGYKDKKINLILGGDDKGADLNPLFEEMKKYDIEIYTIGKNSEKLDNLAKSYNIKSNYFKNLDEVVEEISKVLSAINPLDKVVSILSPAAASLDQYSSYKQRGEKFKEFVNSLKN